MMFITALQASAQDAKVSGSVLSASTKDAVAGAVIILSNSDSTFKISVIADNAGHFSFTNLQPGDYNLYISAVGFETTKQHIKKAALKAKVRLDSIFLNPFYDSLQSVVIVAKRPPVSVKTDTTEFSARAFKVRKNGTVEDMFQKIPGIEVDRNGGVKAQGETVTQIYVDGKPFFGTDLKSVTQNFPADIIDKIQIIDKRSEQSLATKVEDGVREKIINITLKKDRKKGVFGKDYVGYGTGDHYEAKLNNNFFNNDRKISIIAGANNTGRNDNNNPGSDDASYGSQNGITVNKQLKINYGDKIGKKFDFNTYAGYEQNNNNLMQLINRKNIFGDSSNFYNDNRSSLSVNKNFNAGVYFEWRPDTLTYLRFNENAGYGLNNFNQVSYFNSLLPDSGKLNDGNRLSDRKNKTPSLNGQVSLNHRFKKKGRNIFFNINDNINNSLNDNITVSTNNFYPVNAAQYTQLLNQLQNYNNRDYGVGTTVSYTEPVTGKSGINVSYNYRYGKNNSLRNAFDYDDASKLYNLFNDTLSNHFDNFNNSNVVALTYNYGTSKSGFGVGARWQDALVKSKSLTTDSLYSQTFANISPNLNLYINGKGTRFNVYYNFNLQAPQAFQLQPVADNSNPLFLKLGNPDLKFASQHTIRYNFNYYNAKQETGFNSNAGFTRTYNNIANSNTYNNTTGSQVTEPINVDGAYNWSAWFSYFRPVYLQKTKLKWNINLYANGFKNINLLNNEENVTLTDFQKLYMGLVYDTPQWIDVRFGSSVSRQRNTYSLQNTLNNTSYLVEVSPNITLIPVSGTELNIDYDYRQTTGQSAGFNTTINMLNADIVQYMNKKKDVWIKLKAYDILKQNVGIWHSSGDNYTQDTRANVVSGFFLLSFNFRFNRFNHKNPDYPEMPAAPASTGETM